MSDNGLAEVPSRLCGLKIRSVVLWVIFFVYLMYAFERAEFSITALINGLPDMASLVRDMFPPNLERLTAIISRIEETFQMALVGTVLGIVVAVPFSILASKQCSPHPLFFVLARSLVSFIRTVPDLVWALFFVATVGLGAFAGTLTIMVETIGFCGRFFAESIDETDTSPKEALSVIGADRVTIFAASILPLAFPSFINTSLYSLEKAVRSSVVLGLVGAGGIGMELKVAMESFRYDEAATVILCIFMLVLAVERVNIWIRNSILAVDQ